jgi:hypothetical protein
MWKGALDDSVSLEFLEARSREVFTLTAKGYKVADALKKA